MTYELHIDDVGYKVPKYLTIKQFKELANWDLQLQENWCRILSIVTDAPYEQLKYIPEETLELGIVLIMEIIYPETAPIKKGKFDINNISVGLFVDMEMYISKGIQHSIYDIIKLLYDITPTDDMLLYDYYGGIKYYLNWRLNIFNSYRKLFGLDDEFSKNDEELNEKIDPTYSWYKFLMVLADDNFLNIKKVVKQPIIEALNFLAYKKDKAEEEKKHINEIQRNSRHN
jgi:hypothetical protein